MLIDSVFIVFHEKMWNGNLNMFIKKNNHADVPINSFLGILNAKK